MTDLNNHVHAHEVRVPGPGELSYRGMGVWQYMPIPRHWRDALDVAVMNAPGLEKCQPMRELLACDVLELDGSITSVVPLQV